MENNSEVVHLELKYCERCGGLWVRPADDGGVYCPNCVEAMAQMAPPSLLRTKTRPRMPGSNLLPNDATGPHDLDGSTEWIACYGTGGNA